MADTVLKINKNNTERYYIGIDVGTGSVRAALVTHSGTLAATSVQNTKTFRSQSDHRIFEQSTTDIWSAICTCVHDVLKWANISSDSVKGLGFDATCSLAVVDWQGRPISVSLGDDLGKEGDQNVILWADHRAEEQAQKINSTGSVALDFVGGTTSVSDLSPYPIPQNKKYINNKPYPFPRIHTHTHIHTQMKKTITLKLLPPSSRWNFPKSSG